MNAVDTNVLVYACDKRDPRYQRIALELLDSITDGVLLWQVACEFIAAARKLAGEGFTLADAWENLGDFMDAFSLVTPSVNVLTQARTLHVDQQCSFWDAMIYAACRDTPA